MKVHLGFVLVDVKKYLQIPYACSIKCCFEKSKIFFYIFRELVRVKLKLLDPEGVEGRSKRRLKRRKYINEVHIQKFVYSFIKAI